MNSDTTMKDSVRDFSWKQRALDNKTEMKDPRIGSQNSGSAENMKPKGFSSIDF